jgi:hypothetical protein
VVGALNDAGFFQVRKSIAVTELAEHFSGVLAQ